MLKHVQISPLRNRADSLSMRSSISCSSSLCGSPEPPMPSSAAHSLSDAMLRPVSRASSYCSLNEGQQPPQTTIKIFTACLRIDIEYKTLGIQWDTTSKKVVAQLLRRCKLRQRDPRLFYLSMEVTSRRAGVKTLIALDDAAHPAMLQACHPKGESRFCLQMKAGGLIKVHTTVLQSTSQYKSLLIAEETTADELLQLLLVSCNSGDPVELFSLYEVCPGHEYQRKLHPDDQPLRAKLQRAQKGEQCHFHVRRNPHYPRRKHILPPIIENYTPTNNNNNAMSSSQHSLFTADSNIQSTVLRTQHTLLAPKIKPSSSASLSSTEEPQTVVQLNRTGICKMCRNHFRSCDFCNTSSRPMPTATYCAQTLLKTLPQQSPRSTSSSHLNNNQLPANNRQHPHYISRHSICGNGISNEGSNHNGPNASEYQLPPVTHSHNDYSPVYNVREIRTVCHSFSALGIDKKLLDVHRRRSGSTAVSLGASATAAAAAVAVAVEHSTGSHKHVDEPKSNVNSTNTSPKMNITSEPTSCSTNSTTAIHSSGSGNVIMEAVYNDPANGFGKFVYI